MNLLPIVILLPIILLSWQIRAQQAPPGNYPEFSYEMLAKDTIRCRELSVFRSKHSEPLIIRKGKPDENMLYVTLLPSTHQIELYQYARCSEGVYERDYIEINGQEFVPDKLYYGKKLSASSDRICTDIASGYEFVFGEKSYLVLHLYWPFSSSRSGTELLLFDVTNPKKIIPYAMGKQGCPDIKCFNDFDKDGHLDFVDYSGRADRANVYTLKNTGFELNPSYYLVIRDDSFRGYIDLDKSRWFFKLKVQGNK